MVLDVVVIGGSYAGVAAALPLARARRRIMVIDGGKRRNRFAGHSHGFLTRDGEDASTIAEIAREQLLSYPTVQWEEGEVVGARANGGTFSVSLADGRSFETQRIVLAMGVVDTLPAIPGLAERWGRSVFHCPYCHGYELNQGKIGLIGTSPGSLHMALLLPDWGATTFFLNDAFEPDEEQAAKLAARSVNTVPGRIDHVEGSATVVLDNGRSFDFDGLFSPTIVSPASDLARQLGCDMEENAMGQVIVTNPMKATSVPGVFACGDAARFGGALSMAVGDGAIAGGSAHQSLIFGLTR